MRKPKKGYSNELESKRDNCNFAEITSPAAADLAMLKITSIDSSAVAHLQGKGTEQRPAGSKMDYISRIALLASIFGKSTLHLIQYYRVILFN